MDRDDESRHVKDTGEGTASSRDGEILGLGGSAVPKSPGDPSASDDPESVRRRRQRAMGSENDAGGSHDSGGQRSGATGIDMGAGGQGTDLSGE